MLTASQKGIMLGIIAIFIPPLSVLVRRGYGVDLLINIILLFLGWIPGVLHASYIIFRYPGHRERKSMDVWREVGHGQVKAAGVARRKDAVTGFRRLDMLTASQWVDTRRQTAIISKPDTCRRRNTESEFESKR